MFEVEVTRPDTVTEGFGAGRLEAVMGKLEAVVVK